MIRCIRVHLFGAVTLTLGALGASAQPPAPFDADFDSGATNSYGGTVQDVTDGGTIVDDFTQPGSTGGAGDFCWRAYDNGTPLTGANYLVHLVTLTPDIAYGRDISSATTLTFDARIGAPTSFASYAIRLEDTTTTGLEYNNVARPLTNFGPALTTSFQTYTVPLADFLPHDSSQKVNMTDVFQIVFGNLGALPSPASIDLRIDNVHIDVDALSSYHEPPIRLLADFATQEDTVGLLPFNGNETNNYGGSMQPIYGGGTIGEADGLLVEDPTQAGASGSPTDLAYRMWDNGTGLPDQSTGFYTFWGALCYLTPDGGGSVDLSTHEAAGATLSFDIKVGPTSGAITTGWEIRFEDALDGAVGYQNNDVSLSASNVLNGPLTTSYQHVSLPLSAFNSATYGFGGTDQNSPVDWTRARLINISNTIVSGDPQFNAGPFRVDLILDNIRIDGGGMIEPPTVTAADGWSLYR